MRRLDAFDRKRREAFDGAVEVASVAAGVRAFECTAVLAHAAGTDYPVAATATNGGAAVAAIRTTGSPRGSPARSMLLAKSNLAVEIRRISFDPIVDLDDALGKEARQIVAVATENDQLAWTYTERESPNAEHAK